MILNIIIFADMARRDNDRVFMRCEESFITIKLIWHNYLALSLDNCVHKTLSLCAFESTKIRMNTQDKFKD